MVKIVVRDCQYCCWGLSKVSFGIVQIVVRDCQNCRQGVVNIVVRDCQTFRQGLSKLSLVIVKIIVSECQNCHQGLSKLLLGILVLSLIAFVSLVTFLVVLKAERLFSLVYLQIATYSPTIQKIILLRRAIEDDNH